MEIEINEEVSKPIIKVIGVGGGGGNAANFMYKKGIHDVDFVVCNTDAKALALSPIPQKIAIGEKGLGAGNKPEVGRQAAIDSLTEIESMLDDGIEMVFVTAGMGGGTGTGAAPVIAKAAKQKGILTVGIVTIPFVFEGRDRLLQALEGVEEMRKSVDAIIIITNERIKQLYGSMKISQAFSQADTVLATAAKGIAELITKTGYINVDMNDVRTVLTNSGDAIMGSAIASGEGRALRAIQDALESPLLTNSDISSSNNVLLNITSGVDEYEAEMDEISEITNYLQDKLRPGAQIIWGCNSSEELEDNLQVTIVVTGLHLTNEELSESKNSAPKAAPKPATSGSFLDKLFNKEEQAKQEKPGNNANQMDRKPEKISEERAKALATTFYGTDVLSDNKKPEAPKAEQPYVAPEPIAPAATTFQQPAFQQPVQQPFQQPSFQQPVQQPAQQAFQQPAQQQPAFQQPVQAEPVATAPVEPEAPKAPEKEELHISLDDLLNDSSLNDLERRNNNDDTTMLNIQ
ncbi:MAG: cell division protein FtsZ [Paludibacteraceae bacterium]|nr:cell division protein FtsZ [Paludibacteraceae bacterium]